MTIPNLTRSPDAVLAVILGIDVEHQFCFKPHTVLLPNGVEMPTTQCNGYTCVVMAALGSPLPAGKLANDLLTWLSTSPGQVQGWTECEREIATRRANLGYPTVAVAYEEGHGHIAPCVPSPSDDPVRLYVSAAGAYNMLRGPMEASFGALKPRYFTHQ